MTGVDATDALVVVVAVGVWSAVVGLLGLLIASDDDDEPGPPAGGAAC